MTAILYKENEIKARRAEKPNRPAPVRVDRELAGIDLTNWYDTEDGTLVEDKPSYQPDLEVLEQPTGSVSDGVLTLTYTKRPKTNEEISETVTRAVQAHMNAKAAERNYDSIDTACLYAATPNTYQAESQAYLDWRAACWDYCYAEQAKMVAGQRPLVTMAEFIAELPVLSLP
jgi:hypothetical protein